MPKIDLHCHSFYSDGKLPCQELVKLAHKEKVALFSITDHDTLEGFEEAQETAKQYGVPYISGIEISTNVEDMLHILGYCVNTQDENFKSFVDFCRAKRIERIKKIIEALNKHGLKISFNDITDISKSSPSRVHIADVLKDKGYAFSRGEAFKKFLTPSSSCYVRPQGASVEDAISAISKADGMAVLAHPGVIKTDFNLAEWVSCGLKGIEVFYPKHSRTQTEDYLNLANKYQLTATAGSDFHELQNGFTKKVGIEISDASFKAIEDGFSKNCLKQNETHCS